MKDLFDSYDKTLIHSTPGVRTDLFRRPLDQVKITDFFGNVQNVEVGGRGEGEVIDEELLMVQEQQQHDKLDIVEGVQGVAEGNVSGETVEQKVSGKKTWKDTKGGYGFEVKRQDRGDLMVKGIAILACVMLWMIGKQLQ